MKKIFALPLAVLLVAACSESTAPASSTDSLKPASAEIATSGAYTDNFEGVSTSANSYWNLYRIGTIPSGSNYPAAGSGYLGTFTNQLVTLQYTYIAGASLNYDLYIVGTWDGVATRKYGADTWRVQAACGGNTVYTFTTSFSNKRTTEQGFPGSISSVSTYPGRTNSVAGVTLGFAQESGQRVTNTSVSSYDAVYHDQLGLTVPASALVTCTGTTVTFTFNTTSQIQPVNDESWGMDNVRYQ